MFRKGGPTNDGIMTGIVDRENHAISDPDGVGGQTFRDTVQNRLDLIESAVGTSGLDDPLTSFLLQYGPALATARPTGGIIGTAVGAAKEPVANLLKDVQAQKKLKTGVALEVLEGMEDKDIAPFIEKAKQISQETGRPYKDVLNELYQTEIYRKEQSPQEKARETEETYMVGLINQKDATGSPLITTYGAEEVVRAIDQVKAGKVEGVSYDDIDIDQPYLRRDTQIIAEDPNTGIVTIDEKDATDYQSGSIIYDYRKNKFFRVQDNKLTPIGG